MEQVTDEEKKLLLKLARAVISERLGLQEDGGFIELFNEKLPEHPVFYEKRGAFVTVRKRGDLRGCIGNMVGRSPLHETIRSMALACAFKDPRFSPLGVEEYGDIRIEISVLSPLTPLEDLNELIPGVHGLYISKGTRSGVLLPQVALEQGWEREEFIEHTCYKAGLDVEALKDPETRFEVFTAQVFSE